MALAGVIVGSLALLLSSFAAAVSAYHLQRYFRFRKPVFIMESAKLRVDKEVEVDGNRVLVFETGAAVVNARGAVRPTSIVEKQVSVVDDNGLTLGMSNKGVTPSKVGGTGVTVLPALADIEAEKWQRVHVDIEGISLPLSEADRPRDVNLEMYLSTPDDVFVIPFALTNYGASDRYQLEVPGKDRDYLLKTIWRKEKR